MHRQTHAEFGSDWFKLIGLGFRGLVQIGLNWFRLVRIGSVLVQPGFFGLNRFF
jgi:hypothetical protein